MTEKYPISSLERLDPFQVEIICSARNVYNSIYYWLSLLDFTSTNCKAKSWGFYSTRPVYTAVEIWTNHMVQSHLKPSFKKTFQLE